MFDYDKAARNIGLMTEEQQERLRRARVGAFLDGVDAVLDGIDFFAPAARRLVYREARHGIPVVVGASMGWSAAWQIWRPDGPGLRSSAASPLRCRPTTC